MQAEGSFAVAFGVDLMIALIVTEELKKLDQMLIKQLKNRYEDMNKIPKFLVDVNRAKMRVSDTKANSYVL